MTRRITLLGVVLLFALAAGCSEATPMATPTPTRTPFVTPTVPPPTATTPPTATPTPIPTAAALEATPFPPDYNPLTGLRVEDATLLDRIPIAIKISNSQEVRPQSGLNQADLIFEHLSEGRITRFTAIFYGSDAEKVGSVRSGRLIDLEIPAMYQAIFAYSGSSAGVKDRIRNSDLFPEHIAAPDFGVGQPYFYRVPQGGLRFEHTLFTNTPVLQQLAEERGFNSRPEFPRTMTFSETPPTDGQAVEYFEVNYLLNVNTAEWTYDDALGRWRRAIAGRVHSDALTGEQVTAANVVIVYANHVEAPFWEEMIGDRSNWKLSIEIQTWGTGPVLVFRDGQMVNGHWERQERNHMLTFHYGDGRPIPLKPGNTWVQVVPLDTEAEEIGEGRWRFTP